MVFFVMLGVSMLVGFILSSCYIIMSQGQFVIKLTQGVVVVICFTLTLLRYFVFSILVKVWFWRRHEIDVEMCVMKPWLKCVC